MAKIDASQWIGSVESYTCDCDFVNIPLCRQWLHIAATMPSMRLVDNVRQHIVYASQLVGGFDCHLKPVDTSVRDFPARLAQYVMCMLADWSHTRFGFFDIMSEVSIVGWPAALGMT